MCNYSNLQRFASDITMSLATEIKGGPPGVWGGAPTSCRPVGGTGASAASARAGGTGRKACHNGEPFEFDPSACLVIKSADSEQTGRESNSIM
jgi:hypothetical protein